MSRVFGIVPALFGLVIGSACNSGSEAPASTGGEPARMAAQSASEPAAAPEREVIIIRSDEPEPEQDGSTTLEYTRWVARRATTLDRDIGTIGAYLPTFEGPTRADLDLALAEIEAQRAKVKRDLAALTSAPGDQTELLKSRIESTLDALEFKVAQALIKARAPGTSS